MYSIYSSKYFLKMFACAIWSGLLRAMHSNSLHLLDENVNVARNFLDVAHSFGIGTVVHLRKMNL